MVIVFAAEETEAQILSDLPRFICLVSGEASI